MKAANGLVSVIVPYYNDSKFIADCLNSVTSQTITPKEIIIIDDCSNDSEKLNEIVEEISLSSNVSIRVFRNKNNMNGAYGRNKGMQKAEGEFIALIDGDDYWKKNHIEENLTFLTEEKCDFVYSNVLYKYESKYIERKVVDANVLTNKFDALLMSPPQTGSFFFRRTLSEKVKFDEKLKRHQDYQFFCDVLSSQFIALYNNKTTSVYRVPVKVLNGRKKVDYESILNFWEDRQYLFSHNRLSKFITKITKFIIIDDFDFFSSNFKRFTLTKKLQDSKRLRFLIGTELYRKKTLFVLLYILAFEPSEIKDKIINYLKKTV
ncbi:glycosyltransferase family 2 protein [Vibrio parahaemolyticus]|uniref:glycosyltransferase family 2 protein n=3 Tax=Vibrio parahaemolyticus TaxID=670 RepID=UPI0006ACC054|nr:glycosyltransferase family 2 protein [Vibrio parahaemolyticus]MBE3847965.1 glycosyltransferase family 2 protein [Vibrio parahaemolyticus]MCQ9043367.1 glycosyltransferase family 2 protein [Vibrio parahaemolyticus]MCX8768916.1 glycosyltransferase [Vibrio parahaemolyticus]MCX8783893.1 glycosyltransferase [Vibrio parahaemolyticus]MDF4268109.1 glycosyltransferase family 2 protein [Vibrio parahaemolyticus]